MFPFFFPSVEAAVSIYPCKLGMNILNEFFKFRKEKFGLDPPPELIDDFSTSPTGSENHLSPLRFQTFNRKVF